MRRHYWLINVLIAVSTCGAQSFSGRWEGILRQAPPKPGIFFEVTVTVPGHARLDVLGQREEMTVTAPTPDKIEFRDSEGKLLMAGTLKGASVAGVLYQEDGNLFFEMQREADFVPSPTRDGRWVQDLDYTERHLLRLDNSFTPSSRQAFQRAIEQLRDSVASLNDDQLIVGLAEAVALAHNAHTRLYLLRNRSDLRRYSVRVWWFGDRLYVVRAAKEHANIVGCEVTKIADVKPAELFKLVTPMYSGSQGWTRYMSTYTMTSPEVLHGLGLLHEAGDVALQLVCHGKRQSAQLFPLPLARSRQAVESWQDLAPTHVEAATPVHVAMADTPLYLRHPNANYWFEYLPAEATLYFQFNRAQQDKADPLSGFGERLMDALKSHPVRALVVDLRFNTGGNLELGRPLMQQLQAQAGKIRVYVIEGGTTFSAGLYHVAQWKNWGKATLVGEAPGDRLDFWAEGGNLTLPNSDLTLHFANAEHCYGKARANDASCLTRMPVDTLEPDLPTSLSFADYTAGADPAIAAILKDLAKKKF